MAEAAYRIVEHDGGWAYQLDGSYSETFRSRAAAERAALDVASRHQVPGDTDTIAWEDAEGHWHEGIESGSDRPRATVDRSGGGRQAAPVAALPAAGGGPYSLATLILALGLGFLFTLMARQKR